MDEEGQDDVEDDVDDVDEVDQNKEDNNNDAKDVDVEAEKRYWEAKAKEGIHKVCLVTM